MPIVMGFRAKVVDLARQGYGHEDICVRLNCVGVARLHVKHIVLHEIPPSTIGGAAGPVASTPCVTGPAIRRQE